MCLVPWYGCSESTQNTPFSLPTQSYLRIRIVSGTVPYKTMMVVIGVIHSFIRSINNSDRLSDFFVMRDSFILYRAFPRIMDQEENCEWNEEEEEKLATEE